MGYMGYQVISRRAHVFCLATLVAAVVVAGCAGTARGTRSSVFQPDESVELADFSLSRADALVVNIGDIVQVWSNDRYRAALHRVTTNTERDRYSVPFFLNPAYAAHYAPLPSTVDASHPPRYRPINWGEFRRLRTAGDYADQGEEVQISHYAVGA